ncbi:MAG: hypothetical protein L0Z50_08285 [Verrucomicrobiales bacterium]|nr:hypothetical protein [Verrucomicrobiales bacterium]
MDVSDRKLKKRSDANLTSLLEPERAPLVFFIDRSLGRKIIPGVLRQAGEEIRIHDDLFPQDAPDEVWLAEVGRNGWVVFTKDKRIRYRANERNALVNAKVRAFVLTARGDLQGREIAEIFIVALPAIKRLCVAVSPPFIAHVSREGKVSLAKS